MAALAQSLTGPAVSGAPLPWPRRRSRWQAFAVSSRRVLALGLGLSLALAASLPAHAAQLQGQVELQPPFPLPADALLDVQLLELGRPEANAVLVGRQQLRPQGRSPYPFVLNVLDGAIVPGRRYVLRAHVHQAGRLLFRSEAPLPLPPSASAPLRLSVVPVGDAPLRGLTWLRAPAASLPPPPGAPRQEQQIRLDPLSPELSGSGDCNRFVGRFRVTGDQLRLEPQAGTMLACEPAVMADEQRFLADLLRVRRWRLDGEGRLELLDGGGAVLLRLQTRPQ